MDTHITDCWNHKGAWGDKSCPELSRTLHCHNCSIFSQAGRALLDREPPAGYAEEWARLLSSEKGGEAVGDLSVNLFRIGKEWFALPSRCFSEVISQRPIRRIPHRTGGAFSGVVSVRGAIYPCFSFQQILRLESLPATAASPAGSRVPPRLIVLDLDKRQWVFPVDEFEGLYRTAEKEVTPPPSSLSQASVSFCRGVLHVADRSVGLLDTALLLQELEKIVA